jgi:hypothetical protein
VTKADNDHVYVFCAVRGLKVPRAVAKLPTMPGGAAARAIPLTEDISLVVADVPAATYRSDTLDARMSDLDWVARCGTAHHAVADAIASTHTVVPFRLFTIFSSEARARSTLRRAAARIDEALNRVKGKAEWALRIGKPDAAPLETDNRREKSKSRRPGVGSGPRAKAGAGPHASQPRVGPGVGPGSGTSFLAQKAAAKQAAADLAARVRGDAAHVFDTLADIADEASERSNDAAAGLLVDAAFLVPARRTAAFKKALQAAAQGLLRDGCRVTLTGPWPPYSFVSLETRIARD